MPIALRPPPGTPGSAWPAIVVGLFVAFGGVLFGYDTGTIGDILAMPYFLEHFTTPGVTNPKTGARALTTAQNSEIVSLLSAGTFFGALFAGPMNDFIGRRFGLMACTIVFTFGVILQTAATGIALLVAGRFFAGLGVGMISMSIPLYQSETAPKWIRGTIVGAYQFAITIGLLLASIVGNATKDRNDTGSYRIPIAIQFAWALILFFGMLILPETPRMQIKRGRRDAAAHSLSRLRRLDIDHPALQEELNEISANHEYELALGKAPWMDLFKGTLGKRLATGCLLQALQQLTGVNFIFYYGPQYFKNAGFNDPFTIGLITTCINVGSTLPGLYLVEAWGRRSLLMFGAIGMAASQFIVAGVGTGEPITNLSAQRASIAFVCIYIFFFASSWGPCAWVVTGEIFPLKVRSRALGITTASNWLLNWAIAYSTPYLVGDEKGDANLGSKIFFVWGGFCFICFFFVWALIYETKGLSLEQVDELYAKEPKAWRSRTFVPTVSFQDIQEVHVDARKQSLAEIETVAIRKKSIAHESPVHEHEPKHFD